VRMNLQTAEILFIKMFTFLLFLMTRVADVVELVGSSDKSWQDADQVALE
jgi:hypothetical protein